MRNCLKTAMEDHAFNRRSPVNGKVFGKYGKPHAGQKNPEQYRWMPQPDDSPEL